MNYFQILDHYNLTEDQIADMFKITLNELQNSENGNKIKKGIEQFHYSIKI